MFGIKPSADFNMSKFFLLFPMAVAGSTEGFFAYSFAYYHLVFLSNVNCLCGFARPGTIASVFTEWVSVLMAFGVFSDIGARAHRRFHSNLKKPVGKCPGLSLPSHSVRRGQFRICK